MARIFTSGFESGSGEFTNSGSYADTTSPIHAGSKAMNCLCSTGTYVLETTTYSTAAHLFFRFYIRIATAPDTADDFFNCHGSSNTHGNSSAYLILNTDRTIQLADAGGNIGSPSSALSLDTWYYVEVEVDTTPSSGSRVVKARVNGSEFASASNRTTATTLNNFIIVGTGTEFGGNDAATGQWYIDDLAINDSTTGSDNSYPGALPTLEQEGFRFRNDDGSESAATWLASQDTVITQPSLTNTRLRVLLNASLDYTSSQYQLEYKKSTESVYKKLLVRQNNLPRFVSAGTDAGGLGAVTAGIPTDSRPGDILLLFVQSENEPGSAPAGWAAVGDSPQGTGTAKNAASTALEVYWKRATESEADVSVADRGDHTYAVILAFRGCIESGDPWEVTSGGVQAVAAANMTIGGDTTTVDNCLVVIAAAHDIDLATPQFSGWTNSDLSNVTECFDGSTASADGGGIGVAAGGKVAAGAYGNTTVTIASTLGAFLTIALKPATAPEAPYLAFAGQEADDINGVNVTITFTSTPQEGDLVLVFGGHPHQAATNLGPSTAGYTAIATHTAAAPNFGAWYKVMGSSPDTSVVCYGSGNALDGTAYACYVIRGADPDSPFDATATTAGPTTSTNPDPPSITTVTNNALVIAMSGSQVTDATPGTIASYHATISGTANDSNDITVGGAMRIKASFGTEDPGAWSTWSSGANYSITVAIRPRAYAKMLIAASSNIAASGANTTVQLTAPSGKATSDFVAGRIQDDENPADAVDITTDDYTEMEWCLQATSLASNGDIYTFRVTNNGTALDTYTVTPQWTIGSAGANPTSTNVSNTQSPGGGVAYSGGGGFSF